MDGFKVQGSRCVCVCVCVCVCGVCVDSASHAQMGSEFTHMHNILVQASSQKARQKVGNLTTMILKTLDLTHHILSTRS